jgi:HAD superfamily hydrolase (TIGR01509 family)
MIKGVAFDMDGTLTRPVIDFGGLRRKLGIESRIKPVYEQVMEMDDSNRDKALAILESEEMAAAAKSEANPGLYELIDYLERGSIRKGIFTRNSRPALELTLKLLHLSGRFAPLVTREHKLKLKPEPDMILHILEQWSLGPEEVLVVGDYEFDVMAGKAANCRTVFLNHHPGKPAAVKADFEIHCLDELVGLIRELNGDA